MIGVDPARGANDGTLGANALMPIVEANHLARTYGHGPTRVKALRDVSFQVASGTVVVLRGRSGSGKTTMLNILGGLDRPTRGAVFIGGTDLATLDDRKRLLLRRTTVGFVFQSFGLIPFLTAQENVEVPLRIARVGADERAERVQRALDLVGLPEHAAHRPAELSGGQQQRVAIARVLAQGPRLVIADEPTGHLDTHSAQQITKLLRRVVQSEGTTMVVATHDTRLAEIADVVLDLHDGQLSG